MAISIRWRVVVVGLALIGLPAACGGDDGGGGDEATEDTEATDDTEATTTTTAEVIGGDELLACLEGEGFEALESNPADFALIYEADDPPLVSGAEGVGVRTPTGIAVIFVYDSPESATAAVDTIVQMGMPTAVVDNAMLVVDLGFSADDEAAVSDCLS